MKKSLWIVFMMIFCVLSFAACDDNNTNNEPTPPSHTHSFGEWEAVQNTTCTTDGTAERYCSCGEKQSKTIAAAGHQYDNGTIVEAATCVKNGTKKFTCIVASCEHSYTESYMLPVYTATELYSQSVKYVGEIITYDRDGAELSLATGFVMSSDGKIITNYHVIEGAYSAKITIDNTVYTISTVLAYDSNMDLAVLKINATGLDAANICKNIISTGSTVYAIGSSRGLTNTYSQGIVTYANRVVDGVAYIQHDASITHGNSGGPLINVYGEVIGINTWGISDSQNLNFAVFAGEFDNLTYGTPKTLPELFQEQLTPYEILLNWLFENQNRTNSNMVCYDYWQGSILYTLGYDPQYDYMCILINDGSYHILLDLACDPSEYYFFWDWELDSPADYYKVSGIINAYTYTADTILTNYNYTSGIYLEESQILSLAQTSVSIAVSYLKNILLTHSEIGLSLEDFGFLAFGQAEIQSGETSLKMWFINQFYSAKNEYIDNLMANKSLKNSQINQLQSQVSEYYAAYLEECELINERCASMGMTNSGYHKSLLDTAKANYESSISGYTQQISNLRDEVEAIEAEISNPSASNILDVLAENCDISKQQAQDYYSRYIAN